MNYSNRLKPVVSLKTPIYETVVSVAVRKKLDAHHKEAGYFQIETKQLLPFVGKAIKVIVFPVEQQGTTKSKRAAFLPQLKQRVSSGGIL